MEYLDDDAFGALAYEEEEFEQDLQTKTHPQKGSDEILPELSDDEEDVELAAVDSAKENHQQQQNVQPEEHMARKRGPIGVFNDYSPIDWHMRIGDEEGQAKRRRLELEEAVGRATMRILAARTAARRQQQQQRTNAATGEDILGKTASTRKNKLLRVPPMNGQIWWGINSVDGTFRRYLSTRRHQDGESALAKFAVQLADDDASLAKLVLAEERVHEREQQQQQHNQSLLKDVVDVQMVDVDLSKKVKKGGPSTSALWTDKYAPRTFLDLLTEDETNRTVLLWLRLWDEFVFGNRGHKGMANDFNRKGNNNPSSSLWDTLEERDKIFFEMERPKGTESRVPKQKILALFGPSGVGKSSLARVAALQAGYSPVIIPISEFQNVAELKSRLENATDSTSIDALFHNLAIASSSEAAIGTRPCCFIVDAVEQASSEMVQFLCSWVRRSRISSSSTAAAIRRRPVICTCASLWNAPSLRELRVNCLPVRVQRCNRERMQRRLEQVCHSEGVLIGRDHLDELLLSHGSDIRLCLNTLQFSTVKTAKLSSKTFSTNFAFTRTAADQRATACAVPSPVNTAVTASLFDTLSAIFTLDYHEDNRCIVRPPPFRARALQTLFGQMPSDDFGRLQQLVFNNFATALKLNMAQCRFVSVMFTECDALQTLLRQAQHFVLARYIPFALALVHFHCALRVSRRLQFNLAVLPFVEQQRENLQIARSLRASACTGNRYVGLVDLFTWFAPLLWLVLQPPVKPSLWADGGGGQEQRQLIQRVVELMRSFRIGLVRTTGADGMARFTFEPAFHSLLISEPVKQYIAHQLERAPAKMGRDECEDVSGSKDNDNQIQQHWTAGPRPVSPSSSPSSSSSSFANAPLFTYQHSAGSSQAVRREIRIGTLFSAFQH
uniref:AAA+ ATPase domain-containing protein n=1 Tax=Globodera rostochiensis TaxID=31243 RepID=A0A914IB14_GLORO